MVHPGTLFFIDILPALKDGAFRALGNHEENWITR